jgi:prepilin-type N-terminal cleavage/methylation domain-containing protein
MKGFTILECLIVIVIIAVLVAICPSFSPGMAYGMLFLFSAPLAGAIVRKLKAPLAVAWLVALVCAAYGWLELGKGIKGTSFERLVRKGQDVATITSLMELRKGPLPASVPVAKTHPYHPESNKVAAGKISDDAGGWMRDEETGKIWVNCTHTDTKGSVWSAY